MPVVEKRREEKILFLHNKTLVMHWRDSHNMLSFFSCQMNDEAVVAAVFGAETD
jgi:hypothetical protein